MTTFEKALDLVDDYNFVRFYKNAFNHFKNENLKSMSASDAHATPIPQTLSDRTLFYMMQIFHVIAYFTMFQHARSEYHSKNLHFFSFTKNVVMSLTYVVLIVYIIYVSKVHKMFGQH